MGPGDIVEFENSEEAAEGRIWKIARAYGDRPNVFDLLMIEFNDSGRGREKGWRKGVSRQDLRHCEEGPFTGKTILRFQRGETYRETLLRYNDARDFVQSISAAAAAARGGGGGDRGRGELFGGSVRARLLGPSDLKQIKRPLVQSNGGMPHWEQLSLARLKELAEAETRADQAEAEATIAAAQAQAADAAARAAAEGAERQRLTAYTAAVDEQCQRKKKELETMEAKVRVRPRACGG